MLTTFIRGMLFFIGKALRNNHVFIGNSLNYLKRERKIDKNYFDYIRLSTFELVSQEINTKKIEGNVAELGVYKGKFARYINKYFPDRTLYLFDTFTGFDSRNIAKENKENFSSGNQDFADTSIDIVLSIMPNPDKCKPIKGFFPESAKGIEDTFAFVSLDADLYEPIHSGLGFFYPRLTKGGYIFIHDFNNDLYKGSRKAVEDFCLENNIGFVPIPDSGGTAIITK